MQNKYFWISCWNPLKTYNKIKKFFLPIKPKITFSKWGHGTAKIFELTSYDVAWKDKYNTPRHEFNPMINISFFKRWHIKIEWTTGSSDTMDDMVYWETALYWLHYGHHLPKALDSATGWTQRNPETGKEEKLKFKVLQEPWQSLYDNKVLPKIKYGDTIQ